MSSIPPIQTERDIFNGVMSLLSRDIENVLQSEKQINEIILAAMDALGQGEATTRFQLDQRESDSTRRCLTELSEYLSNILQEVNTAPDQFTYCVKHIVRSAEQVFNIQVFDYLSPGLLLVPETIVLFFPDVNLVDQISIVVAASARRLKFRKLSHEEAKALDVSIGKTYPMVTQEYRMAVEKARRKIRVVIAANRNHNAPDFLRLAWNSATFRYGLPYPGTWGLEHAIKLLDEVKQEFPMLSIADIYQLAGVVSVEYSGGPSVNFHPGRVDKDAPPEEQIPPPMSSFAGVAEIRECFSRMGFSQEEFVTLLIPFSLERCYGKGSDQLGFWTADRFKFDNSFFKELGNQEFGPLKLFLDNFLLKDPIFCRVVSKYIQDEDAFFDDYALAHMKFSELGFADD